MGLLDFNLKICKLSRFESVKICVICSEEKCSFLDTIKTKL